MAESSNQARERALRRAILAGDPAAFEALFRPCFRSLHSYVHARTGRHDQRTEDAVQECWLVVVRRIRDFDPARGPFEAWLRGIADHVLRNAWRKAARTERETEDAAQVAVRDDGRDVDSSERMELALTALPGDYQDVLRRRYQGGDSVPEIAQHWGRSVKAVESLLTRARQAFRKAWQRLEGPEGGRS